MNNFTKKSTSAVLAALMSTMSFPVFAEKELNLPDQQQTSLSETEKSSWQTVKEKTKYIWAKVPKSAKVFGGIALASLPVIIGGRIYYVDNIKPTVDAILGCQKLNQIRERLKNKSNRTQLDKMITALLLIMPSYVLTGQKPEACLIQLELLRLNSEREIMDRINNLESTDLFRLSQLLQIEKHGLTQEIVNKIKQEFLFRITSSEIDDFDFITRNIPELNGRTLFEWNSAVAMMVTARLQELNQITLDKHGFKIIRSLGSGQSGEVYLCKNSLGNEVAVKVMPQKGGIVSKISIKNEKALWEEIRDLPTEHVIKYQDQFGKDGMACFSMEYFAGCRELAQVPPSDRNQVINWSKQLFEGLTVLHERGIAHRDIKLENVLIHELSGQIKICDFGLAKHLDSTISVCGTPGMMAPEVQRYFPLQPKADSIYDGAKFDVYSAAAVVYCLMFNKKSTDMADEKRNIELIRNDTNDRFGNAIGQDIQRFFTRCLCDNPQNRPTSAEALKLLNHIS